MSCHACLQNVIFSKIAIAVTMSSPWPGLSGVRFLATADLSLQYKECLCITHTVERNYISPSGTVGKQLHVTALYVGHLQVVI